MIHRASVGTAPHQAEEKIDDADKATEVKPRSIRQEVLEDLKQKMKF